jgi:hypothetical protein
MEDEGVFDHVFYIARPGGRYAPAVLPFFGS